MSWFSNILHFNTFFILPATPHIHTLCLHGSNHLTQPVEERTFFSSSHPKCIHRATRKIFHTHAVGVWSWQQRTQREREDFIFIVQLLLSIDDDEIFVFCQQLELDRAETINGEMALTHKAAEQRREERDGREIDNSILRELFWCVIGWKIVSYQKLLCLSWRHHSLCAFAKSQHNAGAIEREMKSKIQFASSSDSSLCYREGSFSVLFSLFSIGFGRNGKVKWITERKVSQFLFFATMMIVVLHCEYFHMLTIISMEWHDDDVVLCVRLLKWEQSSSTVLPLFGEEKFRMEGGKQWQKKFLFTMRERRRKMEMRRKIYRKQISSSFV